jgi:hypothetical protein
MGAIGFPATTREELEALGVLAASLGEAHEAADGTLYLRWGTGSGVELWAQAEARSKKILGLNPYFASGEAALAVAITSVVSDATRPHDGRLLVVPGDEARRAALAPIAVALPDFQLERPALAGGARVALSIAAFAHALEVFESPEALGRLAPSGIMPGLLLAAPSGGLVVGAGVVHASETRTNPSSKRPFGRVLLEVSGGTIDLLVDPSLTTALPPRGAVCRGVFWLSGRAISD